MGQGQSGKALRDLQTGNRHLRLAVGQIVPQFVADIGRADRDHHRIGTQHGVESDHEMRAVLQVEQHPVPGMHAAVLLQMAGQRFDVAQRLAVAQRRSLEVQQGLVRGATGHGVEDCMEGAAGCRQGARHVGRPGGEVAGLHGAGL